jgi:hypothetical protein
MKLILMSLDKNVTSLGLLNLIPYLTTLILSQILERRMFGEK